MKTIACLSLVVFLLPATGAAQDQPATAATKAKIHVSVDARVQLLSIIFRLAGNREYNQARLKNYAKAVDAHFGPFKDHAVIHIARNLRRHRGVSFDAVMAMAIHLRDADRLAELVPFDPQPATLDQRWTTEDARDFLRQARDFVTETKFAAFLAEHDELHKTAVKRAQTVIDANIELAWFDEFFGARPGARFELALGLLNGGGNYGPRVRLADGKEVLYCVLGVWQTDPKGLPRFSRKVVDTVAHEFCHSYCNPLVEANLEALQGPAAQLFPHVEKEMKRQAYGTAKTMLYESLVRACVVRYVAASKGKAAARREVALQRRRGFLWIGELATVLERYESQRDKYPTLSDYMPEVAKFFADYAPGFVAKRGGKKGDKRQVKPGAAPTIVTMTPNNGARKVDPKLKQITVTFDRPMKDRAWAFVGGGPTYPKTTGKASYDDKRTTIRLPVALEPGHHYRFWLNATRFMAFQSAAGVKLAPVKVEFWTRK